MCYWGFHGRRQTVSNLKHPCYRICCKSAKKVSFVLLLTYSSHITRAPVLINIAGVLEILSISYQFDLSCDLTPYTTRSKTTSKKCCCLCYCGFHGQQQNTVDNKAYPIIVVVIEGVQKVQKGSIVLFSC